MADEVVAESASGYDFDDVGPVYFYAGPEDFWGDGEVCSAVGHGGEGDGTAGTCDGCEGFGYH